ncbi:uncharacterized protein [Montipora foliosa]|uniref:uncharacterized protein n=1 Tax=Montipora foliosa TaxID=591990 RepID=UPI0035F1B7C5
MPSLHLHQNLVMAMQSPTDNNSASMEPMDSDVYNNNLAHAKTGLKRRADDDQQDEISQEKISKKDEKPSVWSTYSCLKLDVYTQTEASHATNNKSLSYVSDMVQANNKKLEKIEKFLENLGSKIEGFLMAGESANELNMAKKKEANLISSRHPLTIEADSGVPVSLVTARWLSKVAESPRDINFPALADSTRSPSMCSSPGLSPFSLPTESPGVKHNSVSWNTGYQQAFDATRRPSQQGMQTKFMTSPSEGESSTRPYVMEGQLEALSGRLEVDEKRGTDSGSMVPVIVSLGDKTKKNATIEIPLEDIAKGAACSIEGFQHLRYSQGFWFGDKNNPLSRVWFCGDSKLLSRAEVSGTNPAKLSLNLLEALFSREEMAASNINGARGRELLNPIKIKAIQAHINYKFPIEPEKEEMRWRFIKPRIDSKCRAQRRLQREQLAKLESLSENGGSERVSRGRLPRVDPKEKDQLLYGYSRSMQIGLSTARQPPVERSFQGAVTEVDESQFSDSSPLDELQANEAVVEISGTPVSVE